jgi:hypothetical protein
MSEKKRQDTQETPKRSFSILSAVRSAISRVGASVDTLKSEIEETIEDTKKRIHQITESLFSRIMSLFLIMLGIVFLFVGTIYKLMQAGLDKGSSFLIIGVLVLLLGWIFMVLLKKGK